MKFKNVKVYGLYESMIRSGYPMQIEEPNDTKFESENLSFWLENGLKAIYKRLNYTPKPSKKTSTIFHRKTLNEIKSIEEDYSIINLRANNGDITGEVFVDNVDLQKILSYKWNKASSGYANCPTKGLMHRVIMEPSDYEVIDHINNNKLDNRRDNLRVTTIKNNLINVKYYSRNTSGVIGVSFKSDKQQWKAYLSINYKQIHLGYFNNFDDAVKARLLGELSYFKEYSPQLHLLEKYGIDNPYLNTYTTAYKYNLAKALKHYSRILKLSKAQSGSGHNNALKGIIVQFDMSYPQYFTPQLQRYHWIDIISSQSKMHSLTKVKEVKDSCNKYVIKSNTRFINWLINEVYNDNTITYPFKFYDEEGSFSFDETNPYIINSKEECFQYIISNLPMGFELWMGISTNYLQLKTIYNQRKNHKLSEWRELCEWIKTLPMSELITGNYDT